MAVNYSNYIITAIEAYNISEKVNDRIIFELEEITRKILKEAKEGNTSTTYELGSSNEDCIRLKEILSSYGYKCDSKVRKHEVGSDFYLTISWYR